MNDSHFKADLHIHSTASDGTFSPREIIDLASEKGLSAISLTDHDTLLAYTPELFAYAQTKGIILVTGVEFSTTYMQTSIHILGYNFNPHSSEIRAYCERHVERRRERNVMILSKLTRYGVDLDIDALEKRYGTSLGRPHIAQALIEKGKIHSVDEGFKKYLGDNGPAFVAGTPFSVEEAIHVIHRAGGKAVIAHPHFLPMRIVRKLIQLPFDGIECYYGTLLSMKEAPFLRLAKEKGLLITGGSDYHGPIKPHSFLGSSWIAREEFDKLIGPTLQTLLQK